MTAHPEWEALRDPDSVEPQVTLPRWIAPAPFEELCGMEIVRAVGGEALLRMPFRVKLAQGAGLMHGGAVTALADTAVAMAIKSRLPEGSHFVTVDLGLRFHAPVRRGTVEARARIAAEEGDDIRAEAEVFDERGRLVASFESRFRVLHPR